MVATVCKQGGVNEQFTGISSIVRSFMGLTEAILSGKRHDRSLCKPQTHWLHTPRLSCKDNQVQIPKRGRFRFLGFFLKNSGRVSHLAVMRVVFLLCVCSARSEGQVAIGYASSAAAAPARRGEFIKEEEATTADAFKSLFPIRSSGQADARLSIEPSLDCGDV